MPGNPSPANFHLKIRRIFSSEAEIQRVLDDGKGTCKSYVLFIRREIPRGVEFHMSVFFFRYMLE